MFKRRGWSGQRGRLAILVASFILVGSIADAQVRFVSTGGKDSDPCSLAKPCKTLQRGVDSAPARGEVRILDSGAYGDGATIAKSLTISGGGQTVILKGQITIDRRGAIVALRNLLLRGKGNSGNGLFISSAASVHIIGCEFDGFSNDGIVGADNSEILITDSFSRNNGGDGLNVIDRGAKVSLENFHADNNGGNGAELTNAGAVVSGSSFSGNGVDGLVISGGTANIVGTNASVNFGAGFAVYEAKVQIDTSIANANNYGIYVDNFSSVTISNLTVTNNTIAGIENYNVAKTQGNSTVDGNGTNIVGNALAPPFTPK